jgi:hypothetical protein
MLQIRMLSCSIELMRLARLQDDKEAALVKSWDACMPEGHAACGVQDVRVQGGHVAQLHWACSKPALTNPGHANIA